MKNITTEVSANSINLNRHATASIGGQGEPQYTAAIYGNETEGQSITFRNTHSHETKPGRVSRVERPVTGSVLITIEVA